MTQDQRPNPSKAPSEAPPQLGEYAGERDMDLFWKTAAPRREPIQKRWFIPVVLLILAISVPWYWKSGETGPMILGLPAWIWITVVCASVLACVTAVMALRYWDDDDPLDEREDGS